VYVVCLVCLVEQDQLDEQNKPDEPDRSRRMLKKFVQQGHSEQPQLVLPSLLVYLELWWLERVSRCALGMALSILSTSL
jgi:hypothetical protein